HLLPRVPVLELGNSVGHFPGREGSVFTGLAGRTKGFWIAVCRIPGHSGLILSCSSLAGARTQGVLFTPVDRGMNTQVQFHTVIGEVLQRDPIPLGCGSRKTPSTGLCFAAFNVPAFGKPGL